MAWYNVMPPTVGPGNNAGGGPVYRWPDGSVHDTPPPAPVVVVAPPAPAPKPRPWYAFAGGGNQQSWATTGLTNLSQEQQLFYDVNPSLVNRAVTTYASANPMSHFRQFAEAQLPEMEQDFARYAVGDHAKDHYTDYAQDHYGDLLKQFAGLSAHQRGENPEAFGGNAGVAGRLVFR